MGAETNVKADLSDETPRNRLSSRSDRIIIQPKLKNDQAKLKDFHAKKRVKVLRVFEQLNDDIQVLDLPADVNADETIKEYQNSGLVEFAEPDYYLHASRIPNDPSFQNGALWGFNNTGKSGGSLDADIDAPEGWDALTSASNIVVAVIDTGVRYTHEDLAANMWRNVGETLNGIDDDKNGIVDDIHGLNSINNSGDPKDDSGHGTHVAGIIGAVGDNGKGVVGVAWKVQIMACKFMDSDGSGATSDAIQCIDYARKKGAKIINASWGGGGYSLALYRAIQRARDAGIIFVAAAGNESANNDAMPSYPANYNLENVLSVAATTQNDSFDSYYSNYGKLSVDLAAPGTHIYSAWNDSDNSYAFQSGTSMAAPVVSGVLALVQARYPDESYRDIVKRLRDGTDKLPSLAGKCVTEGRVNLQRALGITEVIAAPAGVLAVKPEGGLDARGFLGGPFDPNHEQYQLSNTGNDTLSWSVEQQQPWFAVTPRGGTIEPGQTMTVTLTLTDKANALPVGSHTDTLTFSTGTSTRIQHPVSLAVLPLPNLEVLSSADPARFQFRLFADKAYECVTEASTDLQVWTAISTNAVSTDGNLSFSAPLGQTGAHRFYRSRLIPKRQTGNPVE